MSRAATTLQRAFELARSGQFFDVAAIVEALRREGFRDADAQTNGGYIRAQLTRAVNESRTG